MAVLPGSLDYLYYNGILDHIPYEAYEMTPVMNGNQYMNMAMSGAGYRNYGQNDAFVRSGVNSQNISTTSDAYVMRNPNDYRTGENYSPMQNAFGINNGVGRDSDFGQKALGDEGITFRESILNAAAKTKNAVTTAPSLYQGLLGLGIIGVTLAMLFKGRKKP